MRHGFEAITIKIKTEDKRALERACLEHPEYGRWNGPKTYADLVRLAIARFLEPKEPPTSAKIEAAAQGRKAIASPIFVHRYRASASGHESTSMCGIRGLAEDATTNIAEDVTCPQCKTIQHRNARAFETPARASKKRATKKAPKRRARR